MTNPFSCDLSLVWYWIRNKSCSFSWPQTFSYINHRVFLDSEHTEWKTHSLRDIDQTVYRYQYIEAH